MPNSLTVDLYFASSSPHSFIPTRLSSYKLSKKKASKMNMRVEA